ncbi:MAG: response regulator [Spirochaetes bacterium]|nr:response regulator [Spirochaetota bacterium]
MQYIIIIDDSLTIRAIVELVLKNLGYAIQHAENGEDALKKIREIIEKGDGISLCVTDINMPVMDGISFLEEFKKIDKFTPVVMLTTESNDSRLAECKKLGASAWITKPFHPDKLLSTVKRLLK